ncbi:MAG: hypothetical protein ACYTDU_06275 [Planctomycetota bacterium]|jgi:hypothetical protein
MMRTVVAACLLGAVAAADAGDDFESRVAQVIFNTSKMERLTEAPDTDTIERWRHEKDNGEVIYSYRTPREVEDHGVPILWQFQIRVLPPDWKPDPAGEKKWAEKVVGTDSKTEAECAFLVSKGGEVRRTKVYFRIVKGSVKLVMAVTRPGPEEAKGAIEKALERWHFFYEEAKRYGLFEDARFLILPACPVGPRGPIFDDPVGDREGGLDKAEALSFLFNHTETVTFPLKVQVEAPEIDDDKPYRFKVSMKHGLGRPGVELVDGRGASLGAPDAGGFVEVEVARGNQPASLGVRFAAFDLTPGQDLAGRVTDQIAQMRFEYRTKKAKSDDAGAAEETTRARHDVALQRGDWWPVLTRLWIRREDDTASPDFQKEPEKGGVKRAKSVWDIGEIPDGQAWAFNSYRIRGADLVSAWRQLEKLAAYRSGKAYDANEMVLTSWREHPSKPADFIMAVNHNQCRLIQGFRQGVPLWFDTDLRIIGPAKLTAGDFDLEAEDEAADPYDVERELRRHVRLSEIRVEVRRVDKMGCGIPGGSEGDVRAVREVEQVLAQKIRQPSGVLPIGNNPELKASVFDVLSGKARPVDAYWPLKRPHYKDWGKNPFGGRQPVLHYKHPGIWEARLKISCHYKKPDDENTKTIDVAVRYNVVRLAWKFRAIDIESESRASGVVSLVESAYWK